MPCKPELVCVRGDVVIEATIHTYANRTFFSQLYDWLSVNVLNVVAGAKTGIDNNGALFHCSF